METIIGQQGGAGGAASGGGDVTTADQNSFTQEVIEASQQKPVVANFYSPRDGSEQGVGKTLEQAVRATNGAVKLVKVNVDENQALAQQLRLQALPTIYAFFQGRPVDGFAGSQATQQQVQEFIQQLQQMAGEQGGQGQQGTQEQIDHALQQAKGALDAGEVGTAQQIYGQVLQFDEQNASALAGLIRCHVANDDLRGAREIHDSLTEELQRHGEVEAAKAAIELAEDNAKARGDVADLERQVESNPDDLQGRYDLAIALNAAGRREEACDQLLEIIRRNREWNEDAARKQLVKFFEAWGPTDPVTLGARRRLSSILFS